MKNLFLLFTVFVTLSGESFAASIGDLVNDNIKKQAEAKKEKDDAANAAMAKRYAEEKRLRDSTPAGYKTTYSGIVSLWADPGLYTSKVITLCDPQVAAKYQIQTYGLVSMLNGVAYDPVSNPSAFLPFSMEAISKLYPGSSFNCVAKGGRVVFPNGETSVANGWPYAATINAGEGITYQLSKEMNPDGTVHQIIKVSDNANYVTIESWSKNGLPINLSVIDLKLPVLAESGVSTIVTSIKDNELIPMINRYYNRNLAESPISLLDVAKQLILSPQQRADFKEFIKAYRPKKGI
ncbi:hypothetical protein [Geotalea sp. SG265]|uniref:hypothetical protein n=1 Tax=Geotalea sp. SG265 TaxID=2922867 RepID=UPI001FB033F1|nr:hypothetical protein [Geotalea sp. SG265]